MFTRLAAQDTELLIKELEWIQEQSQETVKDGGESFWTAQHDMTLAKLQKIRIDQALAFKSRGELTNAEFKERHGVYPNKQRSER